MTSIRNNIQLIGNLGADPVIHNTSTGKKMARFSLATNNTYVDKSGQKITQTQWHRVVGWGRTADFIENYLGKGSHVGILGRLTHNTVKSDDGSSRTYTDVVALEVRSFSWKELPI